jgi:hypothetical protein
VHSASSFFEYNLVCLRFLIKSLFEVKMPMLRKHWRENKKFAQCAILTHHRQYTRKQFCRCIVIARRLGFTTQAQDATRIQNKIIG